MTPLYGKKRTPRSAAHADDADTIWGDSWHAWREDGGCVLNYLTGDHAGSDRRIAISAEEFERLRADKSVVEAIIRAHEK
jgi:hypothetical protein